MIYLPFIFFTICFLISFKKYGWNVEAFLFLIYAITGVFSILIDNNNLYAYNCRKMDLGVIAPISYVLLLWICIKPFSLFLRGDNVVEIKKENCKYLDLFTYFSFGIFMLTLYVGYTRINDIIFNTEFSEVRHDAYQYGSTSFYNHLSGIPRYICALSTFFFPSAFICLLIFFYNIVCRPEVSWIKNIICLFGSMPRLISSLMQADRSQFLYWILLFLFCFTLFYRFMSKKQLRKIFIMMLPVVAIIITYFVMVSISRWGGENSGGFNSFYLYAGMNYMNYCNFVNNLQIMPHSLSEIFPLTCGMFGDYGYFYWAHIIARESNLMISTFPTFLGLICSVSGHIVMILYVVFYSSISVRILGRKNLKSIDITYLFKVWIVALVPLLGVFGYFYMESTATLAIFIWLFLAKKTRKTKVR